MIKEEKIGKAVRGQEQEQEQEQEKKKGSTTTICRKGEQ